RLLSPAGICVLSTPNLASWCNRGALLFGYQPFLSEVSVRFAPGRPRFAQAEKGGGHLRIFTHRALREFVTLHGFEIVAEQGIGIFDLGEPPGSALMRRVMGPIDALLTRVPSLACDSMLALRRR
ncbi:MAG: SAM-dependent methyltransferase, partial [Acidobacteria bacterium]|nr:SAM-dependent methyltransferase [Acidobacteriota bacterium]